MSSFSNYYSSDESFDLRYEALKCDCGLRAVIRVTESDKPSKGRLWCTPKSVTMVERLRNERMLDQNQNMETVGLKVKNQTLEQSNAFMKQLVVGLLTICIVMSETQSENKKNKGKSSQVPSVKAHWDAKSNEIFIKLCVGQVKVGRRPGTHLDRVGWENVITKFKSRDTLTGAISAFDELYPNAVKFRRIPLQFTEDLDILFSDAAATEEWTYTPSSRVMPHTDETPEEFHTPHDAKFHDDVDLEVVHPSELNKKWSSNIDGSSTKSKTKKKFTSAALLNKTLDRIVNVVESSSATSTQTSSRYHSIAECLAKLESIPGVSPDDVLYV
ncbi:L10-interacting MYB domain-containing protein [Camellia lanceoleosa]|uniref:L10-interacting MYB domain-containing protein n=1 Tax=Camellia lanceoleosa TaxID=1840588 RepID=A0ACC0G1X7_9ERIC|nr:L10-interacting MYB domain-containing protein [Camellia lanceoleosa]